MHIQTRCDNSALHFMFPETHERREYSLHRLRSQGQVAEDVAEPPDDDGAIPQRQMRHL